MASSEIAEKEVSETLNCKTWVLKVSIHCEGCKRKVKKILQTVDGVYDIIIDSKQHKVTVIGNVNGEALIKKLLKSRKHAEFWPEKAEMKEKKQENLINKEKQIYQQSQRSKDGNFHEYSKSEAVNNVQVKLKNDINGDNNNNSAKTSENNDVPPPTKIGAVGQSQESKSDETKPKNSNPENKFPATDKKYIKSDGAAGADNSVGGGGGDRGKKKGKKGQKSNNTLEGVKILRDTAENIGSNMPVNPATQSTATVNNGLTRQHLNPYPSNNLPPMYVTSYSMANRSSSYSETYYAQSPSYTYDQQRQPPPSCTYMHPNSPPLQQSDSFTVFSDENANGCSIM